MEAGDEGALRVRVFDKRGRIHPPFNPDLARYWYQRHQLFSRYDRGVKIDAEGWFSVTPECTAAHISRRLAGGGGLLFVDAFVGIGGNAIQQARLDPEGRVIAIDVSPEKVAIARHNAKVYGVADRIEFVVADFMSIAPRLRSHVVFLSPPWGGIGDEADEPFQLGSLRPCAGEALLELALGVAPTVGLYLPRTTATEQLEPLARLHPSGRCELQQLLRPGKKGAMKLHSLLACFDETPAQWLRDARAGVHVTKASVPLGEREPFPGEAATGRRASAVGAADAWLARVEASAKRRREEAQSVGMALRVRSLAEPEAEPPDGVSGRHIRY